MSKRISAHIVHSVEDGDTSTAARDDRASILPNQTNAVAKRDDVNVPGPLASSSSMFTRKRTYSTPYPFESTTESAVPQYRAASHHSKPSRSASGATRPSISSSTPPSRIPKPSPRVRSSSKSSRHDAPSASVTTLSDFNVGTSRNLLKTQTIPMDSSDKSESAHSSGSKVYSDGLPAPPENVDAEPPSAQPGIEHWYRGEGREGGGRNGGRGEIRAGTQEMLAIALGGHAKPKYLSRESWISAQRSYDDGDYHDSHEHWGHRAWAEDYVLDERMLTDMEADGDATDSEVPSGTPISPAVEIPNAQTPKPAIRQPPPSSSSGRAPLATPTTPPRTQPKSKHPPSPPSTSPGTSNARSNETRSAPRVRRKNSFPPTSNPAYDLGSVSALADAVPFLESQPILPPSGNWDEVILPTVAKRMRMVRDESSASVTMLGSTSKSHTKRDSTKAIPPAPGTFDYNRLKTHTGVRDHITSEMGVIPTEQQSEHPIPAGENITIAPVVANPSIMVQSSKSSIQQISGAHKEASNGKAETEVASPSVKPHTVADDHSGGCCRCIVM